MTSNILEIAHRQSASPLFNLIPAEIRNEIFEYALTAYDDKTKPYQNGSYYYRPGHRYAHKVDTDLLLTCRRIYAETKDIPASINPYTCWFERAPPNTWNDWYWWENEERIALDPKLQGMPSGYSNASDTFAPRSWGSELQKMEGLKVFRLELETVEKKKDELDAIVARAPGWQFPLHGDQVMILDERKTQRTGWLGHRLGMRFPQPLPHGWAGNRLIHGLARHAKKSEKHPFAAKERLVKGGVIFEDMELDPDIAEDQYLCYYVVTLTWNARAIQSNA